VPELESDGWDGPLWKELRPLHGYDSTDTQPLHDETTSLHEATGLRVVIPTGNIRFGSFRAVAPTDRDVARVLEAAETGVADYPPEFLRRIGLRGLAVTRGLHKARQQLDGVSLSKGYIAVDALFFSRPTTSRSAGLAAPDTVTSSFETGSRERASTSRRCASFSVMTVGAIARAGSPAKRGGSAKQLQTSRALCEVRRAPPVRPHRDVAALLWDHVARSCCPRVSSGRWPLARGDAATGARRQPSLFVTAELAFTTALASGVAGSGKSA
jgi:hypothetical protein